MERVVGSLWLVGFEKWTSRLYRYSRGPQRRAAVSVFDGVQRANEAEFSKLVLAQAADPVHKILNAAEWGFGAGRKNGAGRLLTESFDVLQAETNHAQSVMFFYC